MPMIGIQFAMYELMKRVLLHQPPPLIHTPLKKKFSILPTTAVKPIVKSNVVKPSTQPKKSK